MGKKNGDTPAGKGAGGGNPPATGAPEGGDDPKQVTHTQERLNELFAEREVRGKKAAIGGLLKELGFEDTDGLKAALTEYGDYKKSQQTAQEQLEGDLGKAQKKTEKLEGKLEQAEARLESYMLRTSVQRRAQSEGFLKEALDDIWLLVADDSELFEMLKADMKGLKVSGVEDVVKKVAELRPHWLARGAGSIVPPGRPPVGVPVQPLTPATPPAEKKPLVTF